VQIVLLRHVLALAPVASVLLGTAVRERALNPRITSDDVISGFLKVWKENARRRYIMAKREASKNTARVSAEEREKLPIVKHVRGTKFTILSVARGRSARVVFASSSVSDITDVSACIGN
jgi:hypothetical protein